ncbi:chorismate dehydratase [Evansella vedderi]|uniref:Chorismate dehydratase n=1 Tax=Evansella vedderi TaxID=38282 RepID=A0ABT9ZPY5_9BACI|nr:menaquinone biosynthesis protein [Evansella vedderi]MDQ0253304.1 chorismate dehydratase [Evansella vedderi]
MTISVGHNQYTNALPLFFYIDYDKMRELNISFVTRLPAELNRGLADGKLDISLISSFSYALNAEKYELLPGLSVSAQKAVGSIYLFSKVPINDLNNKNIALTNRSATSVALLKVLLKEFYNYDVNYDVMDPNVDEMLNNHDACLIIGDEAILTFREKKLKLYSYDLGRMWSIFTGLPMTFAIFAVRKEIYLQKQVEIRLIWDELIKSKELSREKKFRPMIHKIKEKYGGDYSFWLDYFNSCLNYELNEEQMAGLQYYYELAYKHSLIERVPNLSPLSMLEK